MKYSRRGESIYGERGGGGGGGGLSHKAAVWVTSPNRSLLSAEKSRYEIKRETESEIPCKNYWLLDLVHSRNRPLEGERERGRLFWAETETLLRGRHAFDQFCGKLATKKSGAAVVISLPLSRVREFLTAKGRARARNEHYVALKGCVSNANLH